MSRIAIFTTGGTIASKPDPATGAVRPALGGEELVAAVPGLTDIADLDVVDFASVPSWNITPQLMWQLRNGVVERLSTGRYAGAVVTHGTDTVEETAYMLHLSLHGNLPVAFAVAMRNAGEPGADGPRNLLDAARVASDPASRGWGAVLAVNGEIHSAAYVTKTHTTSVCTFRSPGRGPIGSLGYRGVRYPEPAPPRQVLPAREPDTSVALIKVVTGMGPELAECALDAGARGLVIEGSGAGNVPDSVVPGIRAALERGVPVVLASRCLEGEVTPTYGTSGGGRSLVEMGAIPAGSLPGQKARVRLMLALGCAGAPEGVRRAFEDGLTV